MELIVWIFLAVLVYLIFYLIIKAAVRDGILEARGMDPVGEGEERAEIEKVICGNCGNRYDMDSPRCPKCRLTTPNF